MNTLETINTTDTGATTAVEWCTLAGIAADQAIRQKSILSRRQPPRPPQDEQIGNDEGNDSTCGNQDYGRTATDYCRHYEKYMEEAKAKIIDEMMAKRVEKRMAECMAEREAKKERTAARRLRKAAAAKKTVAAEVEKFGTNNAPSDSENMQN